MINNFIFWWQSCHCVLATPTCSKLESTKDSLKKFWRFDFGSKIGHVKAGKNVGFENRKTAYFDVYFIGAWGLLQAWFKQEIAAE